MNNEEGVEVFGTLLVDRCEIRENSFNGTGAGIKGSGATASVTVQRSAIVNNGRGIAMTGGALQVSNTTFTSNGAFQMTLFGTTSALCSHCTFVDQIGGNGEIEVGDGTLELVNSLIEGNCELNDGGAIASLGGNVESTGDTCGLIAHIDTKNAADAGISALGDHGGPTRTFDLEADSPAIGRVDGASCATFDQRGVARGGGLSDCDAGAVERTASPPATPIFHDGFERGSDDSWSLAEI
jgi:hypothetical protein